MTLWQTVTWDVARAGGFTAYILLTLSVIAGLALSTQLQSPRRWPRLIDNELHNFLSLLGTVFLGVHILAVWIDPFTHFGWYEVFVPFLSTYRTVWMALGIVALYLGIAIGISTLLRPRIGYKVWRSLHVLTLGIFLLATIHGIFTGSDTKTWWGAGIYGVSVMLVGALFLRRMYVSANKRKQSQARPATQPRPQARQVYSHPPARQAQHHPAAQQAYPRQAAPQAYLRPIEQRANVAPIRSSRASSEAGAAAARRREGRTGEIIRSR